MYAANPRMIPKVITWVQETRMNAAKQLVPIEDPICRIKYRANKAKSNELRNQVRYLAEPGRKVLSTTIDNETINLMNIHKVVTSGSIASGAMNFTSTSHSQQGYSNSAENESQIIVPFAGRSLPDNQVFGDDGLDILAGLAPPTSSIDEGEDADAEVANNTDVGNLISIAMQGARFNN